MAFVLQINRFFETIGNRSAESRRMRSLVDLLAAQNGPEAMEALSDAIAAGAVRELRRFRPSADLARPAAFTLVRFEELETITAQDVHDAAGISDGPFFLKIASGQAHARPVRPQHRCQKIVGDGKRAIVHPVLHDQ